MRPWRDTRVIFVLAVLASVAIILLLRAAQAPTPTRAKALQYRPVSAATIIAFYEAHGSQLANERSAEAILHAAARHDVDPGVLVSVTGQEQGYAPLGQDPRIAMNPFNVYGCWCKTTIPIEESAEVAAGTIAHRLQCLPKRGSNLIVWINSYANPCVKAEGVYAEDRHWGVGVALIYRDTVAPALGLDAHGAVYH
ncbi:MAG TPA: hypothetical protein VGF46_07095 [Gaiellales bacterium]|jgi:hypothetical protein